MARHLLSRRYELHSELDGIQFTIFQEGSFPAHLLQNNIVHGESDFDLKNPLGIRWDVVLGIPIKISWVPGLQSTVLVSRACE